MKRWATGFSLVELMIVIAVISILATALFVNFSNSTEISRDAQRKADLVNLQNAIELYRLEEGRFPEACKGPTVDYPDIVLSGHSGIYECVLASEQYIEELAPKYIPELPRDPKLNGDDSGYVYAVNASGTAYKVMALDTVESETVDSGNKFFRCDSSFPLSFFDFSNNTSPQDPGLCVRSRTRPDGNMNTYMVSGGSYSVCRDSGLYGNDFALSGGYSTSDRGNSSYPEKGYEYDTEIVRCQ
jgi:general secretion pathway protein G